MIELNLIHLIYKWKVVRELGKHFSSIIITNKLS